jgi:putative ABC transport system permease protein
MNRIKPPRIAAHILYWISSPAERLSVLGDYEEIFLDLVETQGYRAARSWYRQQVYKSLPLFIANNIIGSFSMLKNYLKLAYRNVLRHKRYALLNIVGLAVGLASCLLIAGYVIHELSFENSHPFKDRIYRVNGLIPMGGRELKNAEVAAPFGPAAVSSIPEIQKTVRILRQSNIPVAVEDNEYKEQKLFFAEQSILEVFSIPFIRGNRKTALQAPFSVILEETLAQKYFGESDPLGRTIRLTIGKTHEFQVTGIMKSMPSNTVLRTPMIASFLTLYQTHAEYAEQWRAWGGITTFFLLQEGTNIEILNEKVTAMARSHLSEDEQDASYYLQPLGTIYIGKEGRNMSNDLGNDGSMTRVYIFSGIALLILLVAAINFINLSTAKIAGRLKEVGIRKTCGAVRTHLIKQFLMESILLTTIAMILGFILFSVFKPRLDIYLGKTLNLGLFTTPWIIPVVVAMILLVGCLAGSYPAFFISHFPAAVIFRSGASRGPSKAGMRRILVGFQFFVAIILIVCTLVVIKQIRYSESKDLGFEHKDLIVLRHRNSSTQKNSDVIKRQIMNRTGAASVSILSSFPSAQNRNISTIHTESTRNEDGVIAQSLEVDEDFLSTMGLKLREGRFFEAGRATDAQAVLINETAAETFDLDNPLDQFLYRGDKAFRVIGVLKDWNTNSIHSRILPTVVFRTGETAGQFLVRLTSDRAQETVSQIREVWLGILPDQIFDYAYVDDLHLDSYKKEKRLASILISFCELTILVACLGIFGLAAYSTEQRTKEIGIRKVLGSGVAAIIVLLSKSYVRWVLFANILAWPVSYILARSWLQSFAYRTSIGFAPFFAAAVLAVVVALLSVVFQTLRAALANPVDSLRYE